MKLFVVAFACFGFGGLLLANADNSSGNPSNGDDSIGYPNYPDMHRNNRAVAFASVILAGSGDSVDEWKAIDYYPHYGCYPIPEPSPEPTDPEPIPMPDPIGENGDGGNQNNGGDQDGGVDYPPPNGCLGEVYYTKTYDLVECEDGRAYIVRSGSGVSLNSKASGEIFEWGEGVACGPFLKSRTNLLDGAKQFSGPILEKNITKSFR